MLDAIQQRVLGCLLEKEATVPDSYPLTESTLLSACNQKSNRDPEMSLSLVEVQRACSELMHAGWVTRIEAPPSRTIRWRHQFESQLGLDRPKTAVLTELLLRGPQAPGALKPRVKRLGFDGDAGQILAVLEALAARAVPLVEQLPRRPRERDQRWTHLLGPGANAAVSSTVSSTHETTEMSMDASNAPQSGSTNPSLEERVTKLEVELAKLRAEYEERMRVLHEQLFPSGN